MVPSKYQKAIYDEFVHGTDNIEINAVAGSGKTTTLLDLLKLTPKDSKAVFLAFSKAIAEELKKRVPENTHASTLHSLGFSVIRRHTNNKCMVDNNKIKKIMDNVPALEITKGMLSTEKTLAYQRRQIIEGMIDICKATMVDYTDMNAVAEVCDMYNVEFGNGDCWNHFVKVIEKSIEMVNIIDFNDMIYLPVVHNMHFPRWQFVFVDECQDLNRTQIEFVLRIVAENGKVCTVGDPFQSIYGFRGADSKAMERLKNALNSKSMPLSICYRCPVEHINMAKVLVPHIEAWDKHDAGIVGKAKEAELADKAQDNDLVLCRVNAPLVSAAMLLIAKGRKATIMGRDIGKNLVALVRNLRAWTIEDLYENLDKWESKQIEKLNRRKAPESALDAVSDKANVIKEIADSCPDVNSVIDKIEKMFSDETNAGVLFSTVHKAKGLEAENVFILSPDLLPLKRKNQTEWEKEQERNIEYVAYTRAKRSLTFLNK